MTVSTLNLICSVLCAVIVCIVTNDTKDDYEHKDKANIKFNDGT